MAGREAYPRSVDERRVAELRERIEALAADPTRVKKREGKAVDKVIAALDEGELRVAEPSGDGWVTHAWIKEAILLYFSRMESVGIGTAVREVGARDPVRWRVEPPSYFDKLPTKRNYSRLGARCVPGGVARYGSFLGKNAILMPGFVNIGAYVDEGSMVDTWATVGSCAQIGKNVHLAGGVGIGGVLEPPQAQPVIVEDGAFIGSRCIVVEGVRIGAEAVLGAAVVLTASTPVVDVRGSEPKITRGAIQPRCVVIPGTLPKRFPAGEFGTPCALVIGTRSESTDRKTSLNAALREYEVAV
ncbi:MAG: 2,3,4,5-tetrahydropyridine-2,6-dicarboxylate N-succinyltransferase [Candidatus Eremiobacteraeota bacterium]|nr:2,3,4,5-tetrahydropyridine-2,6-dicarboxylate N-succinyltransferase [Candidatus Eremiobacteraeota bacterium]